MTEYIISFCDEFQYPIESKQELQSSYEKLKLNTDAFYMFQKYIELYNRDELIDYDPVLPLLDKSAELIGVHRYTVHLLFYICLSRHLRERYEKTGLPYEVFYDSVSDLKWKLFECHKMHNVWGSFVAAWFPRFFQLTRFAFGRLQFETRKFEFTYSKNCYTLQPDDMVLNIHIPSSGPLIHEDCLLSYRRAAEFYKEYFKERPTAFVCSSWLLYPPNKELLPDTSNVIKFMSDFDIIKSSVDEKDGDIWRIFYQKYNGCPHDLPHNTSLQRAYIDWLSKGNHMGYGTGVFLFDDEKETGGRFICLDKSSKN